MSITTPKIPVFTSPNSLKFYMTSKQTHKQILTIYNPYEFGVKFKVFCTSPTKYNVIDADGSIRPHAVVDIVVRHIMPTPGNCGIIDRFRITLLDARTQQVLGYKVIDAILLDCDRESNSDDGDFYATSRGDYLPEHRPNSSLNGPSSLYLFLAVGLLATAILCFPSTELPNSNIPMYLHFTFQVKLFCAFILGMITMIFIKYV